MALQHTTKDIYSNTDGYAHMESNRYGQESSALGCAHKTNIDAFLNDQQWQCIYARTYGTVNTSGSTISIHDLIWNLAQYTPVKHRGAAWICLVQAHRAQGLGRVGPGWKCFISDSCCDIYGFIWHVLGGCWHIMFLDGSIYLKKGGRCCEKHKAF